MFLVVIATIASNIEARTVYANAYIQSKALSEKIREIYVESAPDDYSLVIIPDRIERVPFGRNANSGFMLPPIQNSPVNDKILVMTGFSMRSDLDNRFDNGLIHKIKSHNLLDLLNKNTQNGICKKRMKFEFNGKPLKINDIKCKHGNKYCIATMGQKIYLFKF